MAVSEQAKWILVNAEGYKATPLALDLANELLAKVLHTSKPWE